MFIVLTYDNQSTLSSFSLFLNFVTNSPVGEKVLSGSTDLGLIVKLIDRRSTVFSWLLSDARTSVWFSRWCLSGQGVV